MLKDNTEVIGDCKNITIVDGKIIFDLAFNRRVEVPQSAFADIDLNEYVGGRVGIIHFGGVYRIRRVTASSKKEQDEPAEGK